jgi:hypothetical protein
MVKLWRELAATFRGRQRNEQVLSTRATDCALVQTPPEAYRRVPQVIFTGYLNSLVIYTRR